MIWRGNLSVGRPSAIINAHLWTRRRPSTSGTMCVCVRERKKNIFDIFVLVKLRADCNEGGNLCANW